MNRSVLLATSLVVLVSLNWLIIAKERVLSSGRTVLCELAPVDPRSIMQGDYMTLRYRIADDAAKQVPTDTIDGYLVLKLDDDDVASFQRLDSGGPVADEEVRIRFRRRHTRSWTRGALRIGAEAYFFQEGRGDHFAKARYGELKAAPNGECILVGLRDAAKKPL
jgi:uncharacterized membrane-anchored protein